jgi:microcystin-dependent protein
MPANYSVPTRSSGSILTASIYNSDHGLHITYGTPGGMDDASATVSAMQATADPGEVGSESLSSDLLGELQRIRHLLKEITGETYWYETPSTNLNSLYAKGADIALAQTLVPVGEFEFADVTGSGINVQGITTEAAGRKRTLRFVNAVNLIHDGTTFILPFGKIYRTIPNEIITFLSLGSGNWIMSEYSGPHEPPGIAHSFNGASAPAGYVLEDVSPLNCTDYEGLFTEMVAGVTQEGYPVALGTFTADASTDVITLTSHGLTDGMIIHLSNSGGGLPGGISALTKCYVRDVTTHTFKVTATRGGSAIDITTAGTGTHSAYNTFLAPDSRGRVDIGIDGSAARITSASTNGANADTLRGSGGTQTHTLVTGEMPAHTHTVAYRSDVLNPGSNNPAGSADAANANETSSSTGGDGAHSNTQPWRAVTKVVRV